MKNKYLLNLGYFQDTFFISYKDSDIIHFHEIYKLLC